MPWCLSQCLRESPGPQPPTCTSWQEGLAESVYARLGARDFFGEGWMLVKKLLLHMLVCTYRIGFMPVVNRQGGWEQCPEKHLSLQSLNHAGALGGSPEWQKWMIPSWRVWRPCLPTWPAVWGSLLLEKDSDLGCCRETAKVCPVLELLLFCRAPMNTGRVFS